MPPKPVATTKKDSEELQAAKGMTYEEWVEWRKKQLPQAEWHLAFTSLAGWFAAIAHSHEVTALKAAVDIERANARLECERWNERELQFQNLLKENNDLKEWESIALNAKGEIEALCSEKAIAESQIEELRSRNVAMQKQIEELQASPRPSHNSSVTPAIQNQINRLHGAFRDRAKEWLGIDECTALEIKTVNDAWRDTALGLLRQQRQDEKVAPTEEGVQLHTILSTPQPSQRASGNQNQKEGMTKERYESLMNDDSIKLKSGEIAVGWHFCSDFDGLLVGPGMGEQESCHCFASSEAAIPSAASSSVSPWISVKERLPNLWEGVLITDGDEIVTAQRSDYAKSKVGWSLFGCFGYDAELNFRDEEVTHWMPLPPLPEPPKKDSL